MIKVLAGPKGSGKTKVFIDMANLALETEKGNIVYITKGGRHTLDFSPSIRFVNTDDFNISSINEFYGFICGMISQNYDITHIFIDSITKITKATPEEFSEIIPGLEKLGEDFSVDFTVAVSVANEVVPERIKKYKVALQH